MIDEPWNEKDIRTINELWAKRPNGFEIKDHYHPWIKKVIQAGYLRLSDGRCGFERFKDSHLVWTVAGKQAMTLLENKSE